MPQRVFLGTADGHVFGSEDSGSHWILLGRAGTRPDAVITAIVVDPRNGNILFASAWMQDAAAGGGVFQSRDGGRSWSEAGLSGQAVRALALAPSNPDILIAGTLEGVYRSRDASKTWERISPAHHEELRNLDSLAFDPRDPQTIYAGTFHLPWKTTDGGRTWTPIHSGMIDDSDVMSLLVDGANPQRVYASACSGIYRSDDAAAHWRKVQGIPYAARRTYAITQDAESPASVYAATSEGLWKTDNAGTTWHRTTPESWVVNAVVVSGGKPGRVLIGTELQGVLASDDGGEYFQDANSGFNHRQILALGLDSKRPGHFLAVLAHSPEPVLATENYGRSWSPVGQGLPSEQALRVYSAPNGEWWVSLSGGGLMRYDPAKKIWLAAGSMTGNSGHAKGDRERSRPRNVAGAARGPHPLKEIVFDMAFSSTDWYAATRAGILASADQGATWKPRSVSTLRGLPLQSVQVSNGSRKIRVVSFRGMVFSDDGGISWTWHDLPLDSGGAVRLIAGPSELSALIAIARKGLYISRDLGSTWELAASGLPATPVLDCATSGGFIVASMQTGGLYVSSDSGLTWDRVSGLPGDNLFPAVALTENPGVFLAASATDGLYEVESLVKHGSHSDSADVLAKPVTRQESVPEH